MQCSSFLSVGNTGNAKTNNTSLEAKVKEYAETLHNFLFVEHKDGVEYCLHLTRSHMPNDPLAVERAIRKKLAIPDTAQQVLLLGAAPHMDWDWLYPFQGLLLGAPAYK